MKVKDILSVMKALDLCRLYEGDHHWLVTACDLYASDSEDKEKVVFKIEADKDGVINIYLEVER